MSIRINNKIIAGNSGEAKSTSYRYVGEIFQSAIPIDDIKVACLDGHKIYSNEGYGSFIQHLISQSVLYPQLVCTEEVWQDKVIQYGSWGQFVINTQENSVRLPKIAGFVQGLNTLEDLAGLLEAGLPNITSSDNKFFGTRTSSTNLDNDAFYYTARNTNSGYSVASQTNASLSTLSFDASLSNPIYGNSTTVQPQAIQYPYYIVLATGVVQEINVKKEVHLNNPFFFGMSEYYENEPNNMSWLKSEAQWNNGYVYESFYEWLVQEYEDGNDNVKLVTEEYDDYNFVINQEEGTFRLPLLNGIESLPGGKTINLTLDATGTKYTAPANGFYYISKASSASNQYLTIGGQGIYTRSTSSASGQNLVEYIPVKKGGTISVNYNLAGTTNTFNFIYARSNGSLYYYVGEVVQNANIINVSKLRDEVKELKDFITSDKEEGEEEDSSNTITITETWVDGKSGYRVWSDGYCEQWGYVVIADASNSIPNESNIVVSLHKPYKDTNYTALMTNGSGNDGAMNVMYNHLHHTANTTSTIGLFVYSYGGKNVPIWWRTYGYIS